MTLTAQSADSDRFQSGQLADDSVLSINAEQQQRAGAWALIGRLLRAAPDEAMLQQLKNMDDSADDGELGLSMSMLALAAQQTTATSADDEFHALFVGLGRGELVPYGSWYLTGYLMEKPLSLLRDDLEALGYQRDASVKEPEDHAAALAEVMSLLISDGADLKTQERFFATHVSSWIGRFFTDLSQAESAIFYRAAGRFGLAYIAFENQYLNMKV